MDTYLQRLQDAIASAIQGMTAEDLTRHPEGKWSTAEVLEHLYLTYTGTAKGFERCLQAGKPLVHPPTWKDRLFTTIVTDLGYLKSGRQAPSNTRPRGLPAEEIAQKIGPQITIMGDIILQCETRFGPRTRVLDHPILGPLTTRQWRKFHWIHGKHHVKQILRLRARD
jgi:hypothetical protein